jgi:hypothetical protein
MINFISCILEENGSEARTVLRARLSEILEQKRLEFKKQIAFEMFEEVENLEESNITKMGRTKLVRVRIRGGKIQRRKKLSAVPGYTTRGGKLIRMSPGERRHRKMSAKRSKFKRRAKLRQALRKRRMSLRKRSAMGL